MSDFIGSITQSSELRSNDQDLNRLYGLLNQDQEIDFKTPIELAMRKARKLSTEEDKSLMEETERIEQEKLKQVRKDRPDIDFFNRHSVALMEKSKYFHHGCKVCLASPDILCELGVRSYVGSREIPSNLEVARGMFQRAFDNVKQGKKMQDVYFFQCQVERLQQQQQMHDNKWGFQDLPIGHFESCLQAN